MKATLMEIISGKIQPDFSMSTLSSETFWKYTSNLFNFIYKGYYYISKKKKKNYFNVCNFKLKKRFEFYFFKI